MFPIHVFEMPVELENNFRQHFRALIFYSRIIIYRLPQSKLKGNYKKGLNFDRKEVWPSCTHPFNWI